MVDYPTYVPPGSYDEFKSFKPEKRLEAYDPEHAREAFSNTLNEFQDTFDNMVMHLYVEAALIRDQFTLEKVSYVEAGPNRDFGYLSIWVHVDWNTRRLYVRWQANIRTPAQKVIRRSLPKRFKHKYHIADFRHAQNFEKTLFSKYEPQLALVRQKYDHLKKVHDAIKRLDQL